MALFLVTAGSASALPYTAQFGQLTLPELSFNYVEGFILLNGQGFSSAYPPINNFDGIGNFSNPGWYGDMPNLRYVRASGPNESFLLWDAAFINTVLSGPPIEVEMLWFFYNSANARYSPESMISSLTYFARFDGMNWSTLSSSHGPSFMGMSNEYSEIAELIRPEGFDFYREIAGPLVSPEPVPEPTSLVLSGLGLAMIIAYKRRQNRNQCMEARQL